MPKYETAEQCRQRIAIEDAKKNGDPTPDEIRERAAELRQHWSRQFVHVDRIDQVGGLGEMATFDVTITTNLPMLGKELSRAIVLGYRELNKQRDDEQLGDRDEDDD
jgi:hypothetical protein